MCGALSLLIGPTPLQLLINSRLIAAFIVADALCCCYVEMRRVRAGYGGGNKLKHSLAAHAIFGSINTKTAPLLVFVLLANEAFEIDLGWLLLDYVFGATKRATAFFSHGSFHWSLLFYHQHRIAHTPIVYEQAHKFHHALHGTTAFDAHVYGGCGLPEEHALLWLEVPPSVFGPPLVCSGPPSQRPRGPSKAVASRRPMAPHIFVDALTCAQ